MYQPEIYSRNNFMQIHDAKEALAEYDEKMEYQSKSKVLDIGCGDGGVTINILQKYLPADIELYGCDINDKMVYFANKKYKKEQAKFFVLDIENVIPEDLEKKFDHVFSFYCLHWVVNQERAFQNIYRLLKEKGSFCFVMVAHHPIFDTYRKLCQDNKWSQWLQNVERFVSPYQDNVDPQNKVISLMKKAGFKNIHVQCKHKLFTYANVEDLKNAMGAISPFKISTNLYENYLDDIADILGNIAEVDETSTETEEPRLRTRYILLLGYAFKHEESSHNCAKPPKSF